MKRRTGEFSIELHPKKGHHVLVIEAGKVLIDKISDGNMLHVVSRAVKDLYFEPGKKV